MKQHPLVPATLLLASFLLAACDGGTGSIDVTTLGDGYIEGGVPAGDVADGWAIRYSKFLVVLGGLTIADDTGLAGAEMKGTKLVNHVSAGVKPMVTFRDVEPKAWTKVSYQIRPAADDTELSGGASAGDLAFMKQNEHALYVEGEATKGTTKKTFQWGFGVPTLYSDCKGNKDGKQTFGILVTNGGTDQVELSIHGGHLFYDDLQAPDAKLRFDAIAGSDKNADGAVTLDELSAVKLFELDPAGGPYGTGSAGDINDLGAFVEALARTVGHFRGDGECYAGNPK